MAVLAPPGLQAPLCENCQGELGGTWDPNRVGVPATDYLWCLGRVSDLVYRRPGAIGDLAV